MSVWIITEGEYSDRHVIGYTNSCEEAEKVVRELTTSDATKPYHESYDIYEIYEVTSEKDRIVDIAIVKARLDFPDGWSFTFVNWWEACEEVRTIQFSTYNPIVTINMPVDHKDESLALRKAQDALYQYIEVMRGQEPKRGMVAAGLTIV